jgi:hypothetical protein
MLVGPIAIGRIGIADGLQHADSQNFRAALSPCSAILAVSVQKFEET